jgi:hypothetical protein
VLEAVDQPAWVRILAHKLWPRIAPRQFVVGRALEYDAWSPLHVEGLSTEENEY